MRKLACLLLILTLILLNAGDLSAKALKIGSMSPLTGPFAKDGNDILQGALTAIEAVEQSGGIPGYDKTELIYQDSACEPRQAVASANKLIYEEVVGVIGAYCSASTMSASEVLAEEGIIMITPASTNEKVTGRGLENIFRVENNDAPANIARATLAYIKKRSKDPKVFLINTKEDRSQSIKTNIQSLGSDFSIDTRFHMELETGATDYSRALRQVMESNPNVICLTGMPLSRASSIIYGLKRSGLKNDMNIIISELNWDVGPDANFSKSPLSAMDGVIFVAPPLGPGNMAGGEFVNQYSKKFNSDPGIYAYQAYDATMVLLNAIKLAGSTKLKNVREEILKFDYSGVSRRIAFGPSGDALGGYYLYMIKNGQAEVVDCDDDEKKCCDYCIPKKDKCTDKCEKK